MREQLITLLAQVLANNLDQRLTGELATGIATVINQAALQIEAEAEAGKI